MNFKYQAPRPLSQRFHCPLQVITTACEILSESCPHSSTTFHFPHSNRLFSHNGCHIYHPLCPTPPVNPVTSNLKLKIHSPSWPVSVIFSPAWLPLTRPYHYQTATSQKTFPMSVQWTFIQFLNFKILLTITSYKLPNFGIWILGIFFWRNKL